MLRKNKLKTRNKMSLQTLENIELKAKNRNRFLPINIGNNFLKLRKIETSNIIKK